MTLGRPAIKIVATFRAETGGAEQRAHPEYLWALGPGFGTGHVKRTHAHISSDPTAICKYLFS